MTTTTPALGVKTLSR
ncbi:hypothetical protein PR048_000580 [Dryococelus australis]|uniref:Uncharacterized protein n=1 Tax=Dryococelus australis TaxID=614101 RepID=A0ABQ9IGG2_9NEOP|nr:hypothetical protein PR048_000580 [Dryococelus australis]